MIPKTKKLFISYRSSDAAQVDKIARDLALLQYEDGTACYITWQDKIDLPPASPNWWDAILDAIEACDVFVFHLSKESLQSEVCKAELEYAHKRNRPLIPVVLQGEFFLDPKSGRYNINFWDLVPEYLNDVQFLFYIGTDFYNDFQKAIEGIERRKTPDIYAPRPMNPDSRSVHGTNHAIYDAACDYAERLAFSEAEKHFDMLLRRGDKDYAPASAEWLELLRLYAELIEIAERRSARFLFDTRWTAYQALFPKFFLDGIFDPKGFKQSNLNPALSPPKKKPTAPLPSPSVSVSQAQPPAPVATPRKPTSLSLMPAPFDWIEIPAGRGTMKTDDKNVILTIPTEPYWIAKYPVTNAQFAKFIEAGGYKNKNWWTEQGWQQREKDKWTEPRYWNDKKWNGAQQPVVGVSWHESVAFCLWLSDLTGEKIMLPTEAHWQYAAQGDDGRDYPWGNNWDASRCNNNVDKKGLGKTTSVTHYEGKSKGDSPFGVVDMVGNVWEWCLTDYTNQTNDLNSETQLRVLRGGSWLNVNSAFFRCVFRSWISPGFWNYGYGFRCARSYE